MDESIYSYILTDTVCFFVFLSGLHAFVQLTKGLAAVIPLFAVIWYTGGRTYPNTQVNYSHNPIILRAS